MKKDIPATVADWRNRSDQRAAVLYAEYDRIKGMNTPLARSLPPVAIDIRRTRASTTFRLIHDRNFWMITINERLWGLNSHARILAAFRHNLIHLYQEVTGRQQSHTRLFLKLETELESLDDAQLKRPEPQQLRFVYVCPKACQELSSEDSVSIICAYCGSRMRALGPEAYRRYDLERKSRTEEQLASLQTAHEREKEE